MKKVVESDESRRVLRQMAGDYEEPVYEKESTMFFFKVFWIITVGILFLVHSHFLGSGLTGHFVSFLTGVFGVKGFQTIEPFLDVAEEEGLVKSNSEKEEE